jgi:hypothetical protein
MTRAILIALLTLMGTYSPAIAGEYAYVLRFNPGEPEYIVQFDTTKDEIVKKIEMPANKAFNNMIVDENGGCYISDYYYFSHYGRKIYYYDTKEDRISEFIDLGSVFGPHYMALNKDYLIVQAEARDESRGHGGVVIIDRKKREIVGRVFLREDDPLYSSAQVLNMFYDGGKYVFLVTNDYLDPNIVKKSFEECQNFGDIFVIDIETKKIVKIIEIPREYKFIFGVCSTGDKIYVAAATRTLAQYKYNSNREILVFSLSSGKPLNKIPISPHPFRLTYDKSVNKMYVLHRDDDDPQNTIEIIDTITDKVIGSFEVESQLMFSVVAPGKIYMTQGPSFMHDNKPTPPKLLVLNTKTDKIIKEIEGNYQGISVNPKY